MNAKQKTVTRIFLALFWISCLFVPWELTDGSGHRDAIKYSPIFRAHSGGSWKKSRTSTIVIYTWTALLVSYEMILILAADKKRAAGS